MLDAWYNIHGVMHDEIFRHIICSKVDFIEYFFASDVDIGFKSDHGEVF